MPQSSAATFGDLLRRHRLALGLTQEALAERAGLSVHGIQKLERGATHPYRDTAQRLVQALQLAPEELALLRAAVLPVRRHTTRRPQATDGAARHNLPIAISSFIGREKDLIDVAARLAGGRLLTLTGVGGCGKTRLTLEVARSVLDRYPDGVWLVELGPLADPSLVAHRVSAVLGVGETVDKPLMKALASVLAGRRSLLVLDNCEHLLQACAVLVDGLLRSCPELQILASSREPIGVDGELAWRVPSLAVPDPHGAPSLAELGQNPAVQLFVERAMAAQPRFGLTMRNAPAVVQICRRLDGIPLALELAAARVEALTAEQLAVRLDQRFRLLTGGSRAALPRQQTLAATLDWSYGLLTRPERRLFERLAVFAGGWSLEEAEAVCADDGLDPEDVLDLLVRLVRKSLVVAEEAADGAERFALLETVREYARQKLFGRGMTETAAVRGRHAAFYSALARSAVPDASGWISGDAKAAQMLEHLEAVHDNLRAALRWWLDIGHPAEGLDLAVTLGMFWMWRGIYAEGRRWLEALLDLASGTEQVTADAKRPASGVVTASLRARALNVVGMLASRQGDYAQARRFHEASVQLWRELDDPAGIVNALVRVGLNLFLEGDNEGATAVSEESLRLARRLGGDAATMSLRNLGMIARSQAQYGRAAALFREAADLSQSAGWYRGYPYARTMAHLGRVTYLQGDSEQARIILREVLGLVRDSRLAGHTLADSLDWLAAVEGARGHPKQAARLFGAAEAQWRASGGVRYAPDRAAYRRDEAAVRAHLDAQTFAAAWSEGQAMSAEQAVACALEETSPDQVAP